MYEFHNTLGNNNPWLEYIMLTEVGYSAPLSHYLNQNVYCSNSFIFAKTQKVKNVLQKGR